MVLPKLDALEVHQGSHVDLEVACPYLLEVHQACQEVPVLALDAYLEVPKQNSQAVEMLQYGKAWVDRVVAVSP